MASASAPTSILSSNMLFIDDNWTRLIILALDNEKLEVIKIQANAKKSCLALKFGASIAGWYKILASGSGFSLKMHILNYLNPYFFEPMVQVIVDQVYWTRLIIYIYTALFVFSFSKETPKWVMPDCLLDLLMVSISLVLLVSKVKVVVDHIIWTHTMLNASS